MPPPRPSRGVSGERTGSHLFAFSRRFSPPLLIILLLSGGCDVFNRLPAGVDVSNPKSAAQGYLSAIQRGDARSARALSAGTGEQKQWVDAIAGLVDGMRAFDKAIYAKFGRIEYQIHTDMHESISALADEPLALISDGYVSEDGDRARVDPAKGKSFTAKSQSSIYLLHQKDGWRVDLLQTYAPGSIDAGKTGDVSASFHEYQRIGDIFRAIAWQVSAGFFKTPDDAARALGERLKSAYAESQ